jgi:hypothetical protein
VSLVDAVMRQDFDSPFRHSASSRPLSSQGAFLAVCCASAGLAALSDARLWRRDVDLTTLVARSLRRVLDIIDDLR